MISKIPYLLFIIIFTVIASAIFLLNHGQFSYSLDDAYIHLAVSDSIAQGVYGIQPYQSSSPSSSLLWPFIFAPFASFSFHSYLPLVLNFVVMLACLWIVNKILLFTDNQSGLFNAMIVSLYILVLNAFGLIFTGMEHCLQVFLSIYLIYGLIHEETYNKLPRWFWLAVIVAPLVRYENVLLSGVICCYLWGLGYKHQALKSFLIYIGIIVSFSLFLVTLGLSAIPNSIAVKSALVNGLATRVYLHFLFSEGWICALLFGLCLLVIAMQKFNEKEKWLAGFGIINLIAYFLWGGIGWYHRYEMYLIGFCSLLLLHLYLKYFFNGQIFQVILTLSGLILISLPYIKVLYQTPIASNNIYQQQYQLSRFVKSYVKDNTAIHDIGWVSYHNSKRVFDLWGLVDADIFFHRMNNDPQTWLKEATDKDHLVLASVFDDTLTEIPQEWQLIGCIKLTRERIMIPSDPVYLYATKAEYYSNLRSAFIAFSKTVSDPGNIDLNCG